MNDPKASKLQYLLINQLLEKGSVNLILPDGVTLEIGILQEDRFGRQKAEDYCYVVASKEKRSVRMDSIRNLGLQYQGEEHTILYEDEILDEEGTLVRSLDVV